ncbi:MAG TPA: glycosyltransferase family 4 protein [Candidatus Mcinerneyibacteriales bacterium]|nr:glycosyltransferase family 4 protein [Candidatus Mcinerneyibacteriales bacterium]
MKKRIGFVGTRFSGLDGVSLEADKWSRVLEEMGHEIFWFGGELDKDEERSYICPEAHFQSLDIEDINGSISNTYQRSPHTTDKIHEMKKAIKEQLYEFMARFHPDLIIAENCLSIPMNIPLGMALTEMIAETALPVIGHHHDFFWERDRYLHNAAGDFLAMAFPPDLPTVKHVVINTIAQKELAARKGISSVVIPNVLDFSKEMPLNGAGRDAFRKDFGFQDDDIIFLQPTRIVARKGIEHAVELVRRLKDPRIKLVITHSSSDEGLDYYNRIIDFAKNQGITIYFINNKLHDPNQYRQGWERIYTIWDVYPYADFITYPSSFEGFGNAFLEAIYFKKPILVNRYSIFIADIEPKGFRTVAMDGFISDEVVSHVKKVMDEEEYRGMMADVNFRLGKAHFSFDILRRDLKSILASFFGVNGV